MTTREHRAAARIERDDVLEAVQPSRILAVLAHFGAKGRSCGGGRFRTRTCPACGPRSRDSVSIDLATGGWRDHAHGCSGDLFALIGGLAGIDSKRRFREVLELAADLLGVAPSMAHLDASERARRKADAERRAAERDREAAADAARRRADALDIAGVEWSRLAARSAAGESYLEQRGVAAARTSKLVRFTKSGDVALALRTADGQVVNVVRRRISDAEPKVLGLRCCPTAGTFVDSIADITHGRDVVLVEGLFDALTARVCWPKATILGAHGASNLPKIAAAAARRVRLARSRLLLVPHNDAAGIKSMTAAGREALAAGLRLGPTLLVVDIGDEKDLNDAYRIGWRPSGGVA